MGDFLLVSYTANVTTVLLKAMTSRARGSELYLVIPNVREES